ncbi:ATP synthase subunit I [Acetatifactor muris]|uniref:ATP synthase I chain n=1 Tax=Acetatifactor muris TaxID=879566 RepID=A0A2K4ZHA2_9FIRM|nr:ATP synthase subunit I [Acetatifactor muris]MCI8799619.1 hypothetical protein [Lachnospiraceae bacterium]MCR2048116.1 ATP synthase subunit I [Acetatifactor muris]SOY29806.1 ATP synthase I chain [Acetatifactor muris]
MKIIETLKKTNRTLLEMQLGMVFFGVVCQAAGVWFVEDKGNYTLSLWFGVAFAVAGSIHMCRTLDRALLSGGDASGIVTRGYLFRYCMVAAVLIVISVTGAMNPLTFFLGYMSLKVTAYLQPITHKLCNKLFHETDPVAEPLEEEAAAQEGEIPAQNS